MPSRNILDRTETLTSHRHFLRIELRSHCVATPLGLWSPKSATGQYMPPCSLCDTPEGREQRPPAGTYELGMTPAFWDSS